METKIDNKVTNRSLECCDYDIFRSDRSSNGGGVLMYCKKPLKPTNLLSLQEQYQERGMENVCVALNLKGLDKPLVIIAVYRPPNSKKEWFDDLLELVSEAKCIGNVIVMGDLNADLLNRDLWQSRTLINLLEATDLSIPHVLEPTRLTKDTATCIDIIAVPQNINVISYNSISSAVSDHCPVETCLSLNLEPEGTKPILKRCWKQANHNEVNLRLSEITITQSDAQSAVDEWYDQVNHIIEEAAPLKLMPMRKRRSPFMTDEIRTLIEKRDHLLRKIKRIPAQEIEASWEEIRCLRRQITSKLRRETKERGREAFSEPDPAIAWNFIKKMMFTAKDSPRVFIEPTTLNEHFSSITFAKAKEPVLPMSSCDEESAFNFRKLVNHEVLRSLLNIKCQTATGPDLLSGKFLSTFAQTLAPSVTELFNLSLSTSTFPTKWKQANITAIWKGKGSRSDATNYRPISILPVLGRTFEKLVAKQLGEFCDDQKIIPDSQFGFRRNSSCEMLLIKATSCWMTDVDEGNYVGALLLDLSKAFDIIPHGKLLHELQNINLSLNSLTFLQSFLLDRFQRVVSNDQVTNWCSVTRGVPQGSCLSPLLFNIYVRNLPATQSGSTFQFADDSTLSAAAKTLDDLSQKLQENYTAAKLYIKKQELIINDDKTQLIIFKQPSRKLPDAFQVPLDTDNLFLTPLNEVKLLGFILDRHFTFGAQIDNAVSKAKSSLSILQKASKWLPRELSSLAYQAMVRTHLEYCSGVFVGVAQSHAKKLETVQKIAARIIVGLPRDAHAAPLLEALHLDSLTSRRDKHADDIGSKILSGSVHPALLNLISINDNDEITQKTSRTKIGSRSFPRVFERLNADNNI